MLRCVRHVLEMDCRNADIAVSQAPRGRTSAASCAASASPIPSSVRHPRLRGLPRCLRTARARSTAVFRQRPPLAGSRDRVFKQACLRLASHSSRSVRVRPGRPDKGLLRPGTADTRSVDFGRSANSMARREITAKPSESCRPSAPVDAARVNFSTALSTAPDQPHAVPCRRRAPPRRTRETPRI